MTTNARANENISLYEGVTFEQVYQWVEDDEVTPIDLTGYTALMHIRARISDDTPLLTLSSALGTITFSATPEDGYYTISIPGDDLIDICPRHTLIRGVYDLLLLKDDVVLLHQYGSVFINPLVTRRTAV